jgi:hypothetical protein
MKRPETYSYWTRKSRICCQKWAPREIFLLCRDMALVSIRSSIQSAQRFSGNAPIVYRVAGSVIGAPNFYAFFRSSRPGSAADVPLGRHRLAHYSPSYIRSKTPAAPMPVPTHMVTMPYFSWRRRSP